MPKPHGLHEVMRWHSQAWLHGTWTKTWHAPSAFFFSKQKAALHGRLCSGRGARRRGRWWAKKSLGSKWLPSLHWASGAVQVLARGGFCLPFMGVPVGGLLAAPHPQTAQMHSRKDSAWTGTVVRPWHRGAWVDTPKQGQLAVRVEVRLAYMCWQQACWQAGHETGSAVGACPGMPRIAKGRPGLSAPQAVDAEVVSRVWQTEVWRLGPGVRWHHELAAEPEGNGAWQPFLLAWTAPCCCSGPGLWPRQRKRSWAPPRWRRFGPGQSLQIQTCNYMKDKIKKTSWFAMEAWKSLGGSGKECWPDGGLN